MLLDDAMKMLKSSESPIVETQDCNCSKTSLNNHNNTYFDELNPYDDLDAQDDANIGLVDNIKGWSHFHHLK